MLRLNFICEAFDGKRIQHQMLQHLVEGSVGRRKENGAWGQASLRLNPIRYLAVDLLKVSQELRVSIGPPTRWNKVGLTS